MFVQMFVQYELPPEMEKGEKMTISFEENPTNCIVPLGIAPFYATACICATVKRGGLETPQWSSEMKKLFVGSLSWNTTDTQLNEAFSRFGEITEAKVISDRNTGRSRGFGFVTFEDSAAADKAMEEMNGTELDGREINVNEAQEKRRDNNRGGGDRDRGGRGGW